MDRLQPDCSACADLCCIAYAFDAGHGFGVDKSPDAPCPNLGCKGCTIHPNLTSEGYSGCVQYTCHGAGVRVTQDLFDGQDWRSDARLLAPMCAALRALAPAHAHAALLTQAAKLTLPETLSTDLLALAERLLSCAPEDAHSLITLAQARLRDLKSYF